MLREILYSFLVSKLIFYYRRDNCCRCNISSSLFTSFQDITLSSKVRINSGFGKSIITYTTLIWITGCPDNLSPFRTSVVLHFLAIYFRLLKPLEMFTVTSMLGISLPFIDFQRCHWAYLKNFKNRSLLNSSCVCAGQ